MPHLTLEETDRMIDRLCELANSNESLQENLENLKGWEARGVTLERFILERLEGVGLNIDMYQSLGIRERFFYEMQQRTGRDYGYCEHFIPAYRNRTKSALEGNPKLDLGHKCRLDPGEPIETTCSGTYRESCVFLHPELNDPQDEAIIDDARRIRKELSAPNN